MAIKTTHTQIANRYVTALFELALEAKKLEQTADELDDLATLYAESDDFRRLCTDPTLSRSVQQKGVEALVKQLKPAKLIAQFLTVLVANRRLEALPAIAAAFREKLRAHHGQIVAEVTTAVDLKKADETKIAKLLSEYVDKQVVLHVTKDASILGGLRIMVDGTMIDATAEGRLNRLKDQLYHGIRQIA